MTVEAEIDWCDAGKFRDTKNCWQPPEARKNSREGARVGQHLGFSSLASKTMVECIPVVLSHLFVVVCNSSPRK